MALKELAILLSARNKASGPVKAVTKDIGTLDRVAGRAGKGIKTLGRNLRLLAGGAALAGVGLLGAAVKGGIDSLVELENVSSATAGAIKSTGGAAKVSAADIRTWSEETESAVNAAVDDKAIQAAANNLLRFTDIARDNFKRTLVAATDLGAGMKTGPEAAAKLLGKALSDPTKAMGALKKAGVVLTEAEQKRIKALAKANRLQDAQAELLDAVERRYKGAAAAAAGPYQTALNKLNDTSEDAKKALAVGLLPLITKVADKLTAKLGDPKVMRQIEGVGRGLAAGLDRALAIAERIPWRSVGDAMKAAGTGAKAALDVFTAMPPWVQTAVLTGWGLNKLSGGMVTGIVGELGKGLVKGVLGMNAGVVNIKAGVVTGAGGPGAAPGGKGGGLGATVAGGAGKVLGAVAVLGGVVGVWEAWRDQNQRSSDQATAIAERQEQWLKEGPKRADLERGLTGVKQGIADITANPLLMLVQGEALTKLRGMEASLAAQLAKLDAINASVQSGRAVSVTLNDVRGGPGSAARGRATSGLAPAPQSEARRRQGGDPRPILLRVDVRNSAREAHRADRQWRRVTSANGSPVTID